MNDQPAPGWLPPDLASRATHNIPHGRLRAASERRRNDPKQPYSGAVVRWAAAAGLVLLAVAAVLIVLTTWTNEDWTAFDDSIECGDSLESVLFFSALAMLVSGVTVVVIGFVRAVRSRSWASMLVSFAGVCLFVCGVACTNLAIQVSYAAIGD